MRLLLWSFHMQTIFFSSEYMVKPINSSDKKLILDVYTQCEDFLSLGPVPKASIHMVDADIQHSIKEKGIYCGIWNTEDTMVGIIDFIPETSKGNACLSLLMISEKYRGKGIGVLVTSLLESYLKTNYRTEVIESGVQVNNIKGIQFWKKRGYNISENARDMGDGTIAYAMRKELV